MTDAEPASRPDTVLGVLRAAERYLAGKCVDAPLRSAELMLGRVLGLDRLHLYLHHDRPLAAAELQELRAMVARRGAHEPLAYVLGDWEFFGHTLRVGPGVLVPRPETEGLVERIVRDAPEGGQCADLGTGCGAIAIAVAIARPDLQVWAVEREADAIAHARENLRLHGLCDRVRLVHGDWLAAFPEEASFDALVGNPPYIDPDAPIGLADDVARFEPGSALFSAPGDPASEYRRILATARPRLRPGAIVWFEVGGSAAEEARRLMLAADWLHEVRIESDLAGLPRYAGARVISGG